MVARPGQGLLQCAWRGLQGRAGGCHSGGPVAENVQAGPVDRPVPRAAYADGQGCRHGVQADQGGGRLLARRQQQSGAEPHLWHGLCHQGRAGCLSPHDGGGRKARPPQDRAGNGPLPLPARGAGERLLASARLCHLQPDGGLYPAAAEFIGLCGGEDPATDEFQVLGNVRPLGQVSREHVRGARRSAGNGR
ncbi:hypothetical protein D3C72_1490300 [compost metagenome]